MSTRRQPDKPRWIAKRRGREQATAELLASDEVGTVRLFVLGDGLKLKARKVSDRRWQLFGGGLNGDAFIGAESVVCESREVERR